MNKGDDNFLKLNANNCVIVLFSRESSANLPMYEVDGLFLPAGEVEKCSGYRWGEGGGDLLAETFVEENIVKAKCALFPLVALVPFMEPYKPFVMEITVGGVCNSHTTVWE